MPAMDITEADVAKALEEMRERAAAFAPVEGRAVENGDYVQLKLMGTPAGGGEPLQADSVLCHIGAEETMEPFNENLRGANIGDHKNFDVAYPADYPDAKLAGKTYNYAVEVLGIKNKKLPELNDEFAKDVSDAATLEELKKKVSEDLEHQRDHRQKDLQREKVLAELVKLHELPCTGFACGASNGCASRARRPLAGGAGRRSASRECGLGFPAEAPARARRR